MKEYLVQWNPNCVDELNLRLPEILKDVTFELEPTLLKVPASDGGYFEISGQSLVKIVVDFDQKEYFIHKLKTGNALDENFPKQLQAFIASNLQVHVY